MRPAPASASGRPTCSVTLSWLAAAGLGAGAYVHLCLYRHGYRAIPIIGVLFVINVMTSAAVSLALLLLPRRVVVRLAGIAVTAGTLAAFGASRLPGGLFHFQERGLQPSPQSTLALMAETMAIIALVVAMAADHRDGRATADPRPSSDGLANHHDVQLSSTRSLALPEARVPRVDQPPLWRANPKDNPHDIGDGTQHRCRSTTVPSCPVSSARACTTNRDT